MLHRAWIPCLNLYVQCFAEGFLDEGDDTVICIVKGRIHEVASHVKAQSKDKCVIRRLTLRFLRYQCRDAGDCLGFVLGIRPTQLLPSCCKLSPIALHRVSGCSLASFFC